MTIYSGMRDEWDNNNRNSCFPYFRDCVSGSDERFGWNTPPDYMCDDFLQGRSLFPFSLENIFPPAYERVFAQNFYDRFAARRIGFEEKGLFFARLRSYLRAGSQRWLPLYRSMNCYENPFLTHALNGTAEIGVERLGEGFTVGNNQGTRDTKNNMADVRLNHGVAQETGNDQRQITGEALANNWGEDAHTGKDTRNRTGNEQMQETAQGYANDWGERAHTGKDTRTKEGNTQSQERESATGNDWSEAAHTEKGAKSAVGGGSEQGRKNGATGAWHMDGSKKLSKHTETDTPQNRQADNAGAGIGFAATDDAKIKEGEANFNGGFITERATDTDQNWAHSADKTASDERDVKESEDYSASQEYAYNKDIGAKKNASDTRKSAEATTGDTEQGFDTAKDISADKRADHNRREREGSREDAEISFNTAKNITAGKTHNHDRSSDEGGFSTSNQNFGSVAQTNQKSGVENFRRYNDLQTKSASEERRYRSESRQGFQGVSINKLLQEWRATLISVDEIILHELERFFLQCE